MSGGRIARYFLWIIHLEGSFQEQRKGCPLPTPPPPAAFCLCLQEAQPQTPPFRYLF